MYSLLNASTLGFDLVRLPGGAAVAEVLLDALALRAEDVAGADLPPAPPEASAPPVPRAAQLLGDVAHAHGDALAEVAQRLRTAPIGGIEQLLASLGREWFDWGESASTGTGADIEWDAGLWRESLESAYGAAVRAAWHGAPVHWPRLASGSADLGPQRAELAALMGQVSGLDAAAFAELEEAWATRDHAVRWSQAMHAATWAVSLTGRERAAMAAQLELVRAIRSSAADSAHVAQGAWNSLSGIVQVLTVADLLDRASAEALTGHAQEILRPVD
ncbi:hypothetical protein [Nocardioides pacificus]